MLVDHPEAQAGHLVGLAVDGTPIQENLSLVGPQNPGEDVHEGGFAGAVLADDGVNLAASNLKIDTVVGENAGELLRDPAHFHGQIHFGSVGGLDHQHPDPARLSRIGS